MQVLLKERKDFTLDLLETEGEVLVYELGCRQVNILASLNLTKNQY